MLNPWEQATFERQSKRINNLDGDHPSKLLEPPFPLNNHDDLTTTQTDESGEENVVKKEGHEQALKSQIIQQDLNEEKFNKLVNNSTTVLYRVKTTFPFTFFPTEIIISLNDVNVVVGEFFISKQVRSVSISKIAEVIANTGFFFAQLLIVDKEYSQMTIEVDYLPVKKAMKAKRLIQGLLFATKEAIDLTKIHDDYLVQKIEELGRVQGESLDRP